MTNLFVTPYVAYVTFEVELALTRCFVVFFDLFFHVFVLKGKYNRLAFLGAL